MSFLQFDELRHSLENPQAETRQTRGAGLTSIVKSWDNEINKAVVSKTYTGALNPLQGWELQLMLKIQQAGVTDGNARKYLIALRRAHQEDSGGTIIPIGSGRTLTTTLMTLWHGFDLQDWIKLLPPAVNPAWKSPDFILRMLRSAICALQSLHAIQLVHCDIRADNICLNYDPAKSDVAAGKICLDPDSLRLIDIGVAVDTNDKTLPALHKLGLSGSNSEGWWKSSRLKQAHAELDRGIETTIQKIDARVDFFSLSAVFKKLVADVGGFEELPGGKSDVHCRCFEAICSEMTASEEKKKKFRGLYQNWLQMIDHAFEEKTSQGTWEFRLPTHAVPTPKTRKAAVTVVDRETVVPPERSDWIEACKINTLEAYRGYQNKHPKGVSLSEAQERIARLEAEAAKQREQQKREAEERAEAERLRQAEEARKIAEKAKAEAEAEAKRREAEAAKQRERQKREAEERAEAERLRQAEEARKIAEKAKAEAEAEAKRREAEVAKRRERQKREAEERAEAERLRQAEEDRKIAEKAKAEAEAEAKRREAEVAKRRERQKREAERLRQTAIMALVVAKMKIEADAGRQLMSSIVFYLKQAILLGTASFAVLLRVLLWRNVDVNPEEMMPIWFLTVAITAIVIMIFSTPLQLLCRFFSPKWLPYAVGVASVPIGVVFVEWILSSSNATEVLLFLCLTSLSVTGLLFPIAFQRWKRPNQTPRGADEWIDWLRLLPLLPVFLIALLLIALLVERAFLPNTPDEAPVSLSVSPADEDATAQYERGIRHYEAGDYTEAEKWLRKAYDQGHADAGIKLADMLLKKQTRTEAQSQNVASEDAATLNNRGVERFEAGDYGEAVKLFRQAAERGHATAQFNLGVMYDNGRGVTQSDAEAFKWYRKAAEQGHTVAQYSLGVIYADGRMVTQSDTEAFKWFRKAAEQGHVKAQYNLGEMYYRGRGVPKNNAEARKWLEMAYAQGFAEAGILLAEMVLDEQKKGK
ncbi:hypothetical protein AGMMS50289_04110 [Betaproteobacteria bacterium]|nr:hypothetical protein AGMMS50289_04110 [Betaproteobacteria bacterium]